jgi:CHAT domain-containing protein
MVRPALMASGALVAALALSGAARAQGAAPLVAESFAVGTSGAVCEAQGVALGAGRGSVFDRQWKVLCRDMARPVATLLSLRGASALPQTAFANREEELDCAAEGGMDLPGTGPVLATRCRGRNSGLEWLRYVRRGKGGVQAVEGLAAYDSALRLALASIVANRVVPGEVTAASLDTADSLALLRARAMVSDAGTVIGQGYRGNNAGAYAEAAELFAAAPALLAPDEAADAGQRSATLHETRVNRALQMSNLGAFDQAARLFEEARALATRDPVQARLARNFEAIDAINRGDLDAVAAILDRPVPPMALAEADEAGAVAIDRTLAAGLNAGSGKALAGVLGQETRLSPAERAMIIDAQGLQLRGLVLRLQGKPGQAREQLDRAYAGTMKVRDGRVVSITRLRAQILSETALTHEAQGRQGDAEGLLRQALSLVETQYPDSASVNAARARLAGFLARTGRPSDAMALYRRVVETVSGNRGALVGMENLMRPYFDLLAERAASGDAAAVSGLFDAAQLAERPGAADSLAQLARKLEGGSDAASDLFRQSLNITRDLERTRIRMAQATAGGAATPEDIAALAADQARLQGEQSRLLAALSAYPQYRAVTRSALTLDGLRAALRPGEAYLKLAEVGGAAYAVLVSPSSARGWKIARPASALADAVAALRDSISVTVNGVQSTYPYDVDAALELHDLLLGPAAGELAGINHLIFEPDGALLQLPINLLTGDRAGVAAYHARVDAGGDEYDFTGIGWLGRTMAVSTALSAASFRDARAAPASKGSRAYLGLGQNVPLGPVTTLPGLRSALETADEGCEWPVAAWNRPIADTELREASGLLGAARSALMTGGAFTDTAIVNRRDLADFRIVHFATHGLVTPPREGCPARPALLTSFGPGQSDGLLGFAEIFDLSLDADLVILSACDTAGQASLEATQEAGVTTGGGQALDGLVRAFIAAGGRDVIASHWPAPDDFGATRRLFSGFFAGAGSAVGQSLLAAQRGLMDDPQTSHPFYWAGFAVIGDGARPLPGR